MVSRGHGLPLLREGHHRASVEHAKAEEVVELEADAVHGPVEAALRVVQRVPLGGQYGQVLHVTPGQLSTVGKEESQVRHIIVLYQTVGHISLPT